MVYPTSMKDCDILIIGAGCSGLSLAYRLINSSLNVCVIDNMPKENRVRKTWSYWDTYDHPFKPLEKEPNSTLEIKNIYKTILNCQDHHYASIDSYDFDDYVLKRIDNCLNIETYFETNIKSIKEINEGFDVHLDNKTLKPKYVFDSRPNKTEATMKQTFKGIFVEFEKPLKRFVPSLMDFTDKNEFHFFYCLQLGVNQYLFESTYYTPLNKSKSKMTDEINYYIKKNYNIKYSVIREEYGEIPLTTNVKLNSKNSRYFNIGIPSGSTRASTGYTFLNIQRQSDEYIKMLKGEEFIEYPRTFKSRVLRKMDKLLLMIIKDNPVVSKSIIYRMFSENESNRTIRFLSDIPTFFDILCIIWSMPKLLFIKYAIKSIAARNI